MLTSNYKVKWTITVYLYCLWQKYLIYCWIPIIDGKFCVPNCKSGYKSQVKDTKTIFHKFLKEWENKIHRGGKWSMTTESFIFSKLFEESNFVYDTNVTNNCRKRKLQKEMLKTDMWKRGHIQQNFQTVLHIFQKKKSAKRRSLSSSDMRQKISAQRLESKRLNKLEAKTFKWIIFCRIYHFTLQNWRIKNHILQSSLWYFFFKDFY